MVLFDLPVTEDGDAKRATVFRNTLLDLGFEMCQYSVYIRFFPSREQAEPIIKIIKNSTPSHGHVTIIFFTDKQYGDIINISNTKVNEKIESPKQLSLF